MLMSNLMISLNSFSALGAMNRNREGHMIGSYDGADFRGMAE